MKVEQSCHRWRLKLASKDCFLDNTISSSFLWLWLEHTQFYTHVLHSVSCLVENFVDKLIMITFYYSNLRRSKICIVITVFESYRTSLIINIHVVHNRFVFSIYSTLSGYTQNYSVSVADKFAGKGCLAPSSIFNLHSI